MEREWRRGRERERIHYAEPLASAPALFSQLSSPATREFTRRLRRFGYGFDHVADRGHLRRALEKVNYAGGTRPLSISKERVERIVCELRITDFSRYNSSFRPPIRRLVWKFERWKFRWKERGCSRLEKYWRTFRAIRWRKCNRRNSFRYTNFSTVRTRKSSKDREQWTRQSFSTCNGWLARACTT